MSLEIKINKQTGILHYTLESLMIFVRVSHWDTQDQDSRVERPSSGDF